MNEYVYTCYIGSMVMEWMWVKERTNILFKYDRKRGKRTRNRLGV